MNGKHFHTWECYREWILQLKNNLQRTYLNIGFLICSNEKPDLSIFSGMPVHFNLHTRIITDIQALALCDYLIGPPSSFGTWVSWFGSVPRLVLRKDSIIKSLDQFSIAETC